MSIEELQSSLEAQEQRLTERTYERDVEQALKASFGKNSQKQSWSEAKKRHGGHFHKFGKKKVQSQCCKNFGHFIVDCWSNKERKLEEAEWKR